MSNARTKIAAQDIALKALRTAAQAEPDKEVGAEIEAVAKMLAKRWGVKEAAPKFAGTLGAVG